MTEKEIGQAMALLKVAYPYYYKDISKEEAKQAIELWKMMLGEYDTKIIMCALQALISTHTFPPSIAEIIEKSNSLTSGPAMNELEAFMIVKRAIGNSTYHAREEFEKLPAILQKTVGSHNQLREWALMDEDEVKSYVFNNFKSVYKIEIKRDKEYTALPTTVKERLDKINQRSGELLRLEVEEFDKQS